MKVTVWYDENEPRPMPMKRHDVSMFLPGCPRCNPVTRSPMECDCGGVQRWPEHAKPV